MKNAICNNCNYLLKATKTKCNRCTIGGNPTNNKTYCGNLCLSLNKQCQNCPSRVEDNGLITGCISDYIPVMSK